ncbi:unnamed protein product [Meloidogyne enterolobii]|uniref:Uncharacterized protein n=1 Tax=Meloidogyne enterolobii TaxID=390850 RepID=A0ACB0ZC75_MELEN
MTQIHDIKHAQTERNEWGSSWQFLLTCIGYAVGLGSIFCLEFKIKKILFIDIWRFPALAYEHGAFLIPYLICSLLIGFPLLYLEMSIGQFCKAGPAVAYGWIRPAFQGIGWSMAMLSLLIGIYYNVIVAWTLIYLWTIITGNSNQFSSCTNQFNTIYCSSSLEDLRCSNELKTLGAFYFNRTCNFGNDTIAKSLKDKTFSILSAVSPAEEFFERYVLEKTATLSEFGGLSLKMVISLGLAWLFTTLVLVKGVEVMGKIAWFTGTTPYIIIVILFIRGITLDGAKAGLDYYLLKPNLSVIWLAETWRAAATQVCYSLAIGMVC